MIATATGQVTRSQRKPLVQGQEPKRLSKLGEWHRAHSGGILEYVDWRAANK
jgi:hypothetical protein